jgi:hypothetical protein
MRLKDISNEIRISVLSTKYLKSESGGLAQLARAPALHAGGQGFDSLILHKRCFKIEKGTNVHKNLMNKR